MYSHVLRRITCHAISLATAIIALLLMGTSASHAQFSYFRAFAFAGTSDGGSGYTSTDVNPYEGAIPQNVAIDHSQVYPSASGPVTFTFNAAANYRGFWSTGTHADGRVDNVSYPAGNSIPSKDPPFGYYVVGGMGSWTKHRFITPESLTGPHAEMNWHVSGTSSATLGVATSRLDFAVTQGVNSFNDLYNASVTPNRLTAFGPGSYHYTTGVAIDTTLDWLFWSSAFWEVSPAALSQLPAGVNDIQGSAEFTNTFVLDTIDLFNGDGAPVSKWSLIDEATGQVIFNQNGRVSAVPEPGALALLGGVAFSGVGLLLRRRHIR